MWGLWGYNDEKYDEYRIKYYKMSEFLIPLQ